MAHKYPVVLFKYLLLRYTVLFANNIITLNLLNYKIKGKQFLLQHSTEV